MTADTKVTLIPWDPHSLTHRQRLIKQRDECGWDQDKVEGVWRDGQTKGYKCIYWIVSFSGLSIRICENRPACIYPVALRIWH